MSSSRTGAVGRQKAPPREVDLTGN